MNTISKSELELKRMEYEAKKRELDEKEHKRDSILDGLMNIVLLVMFIGFVAIVIIAKLKE